MNRFLNLEESIIPTDGIIGVDKIDIPKKWRSPAVFKLAVYYGDDWRRQDGEFTVWYATADERDKHYNIVAAHLTGLGSQDGGK